MKIAVGKDKDLAELVMLISSYRPDSSILIIVNEHFLAYKICSRFGDCRSAYNNELQYVKYRDCNIVCAWSRCKMLWKYCKTANFTIELDLGLEEKHAKRILSGVEFGQMKNE